MIERCFGLLKGRFRRFKYINIKSIEEICQTIVCACILHNVCVTESDTLEDILQDDDDGHDDVILQCILQNDFQGQLKRINITNRL